MMGKYLINYYIIIIINLLYSYFYNLSLVIAVVLSVECGNFIYKGMKHIHIQVLGTMKLNVN